MRPIIFRVLLTVVWAGTLAGQPLTLEDIFLHNRYSMRSFAPGPWIENGAAFLVIQRTGDGVDVLRQDLATGNETSYLDSRWLAGIDPSDATHIDAVAPSPDERWLLISTGQRQIWRRSTEARFYLHDRQSGATHPLTDGAQPQSNAQFSPDSRKLAYVMGHNLYVYDLDRGKTRQLTKDGSETIINGQADWLYEEEFGLTRIYAWSPNGETLAFLRFDQGHLQTYPLVNELTQYPVITTIRYPKVGERNSLVTLGLVNVTRGRTRWVDLGSETDIYIPRLMWTGRSDELAFYRLDRRQQRLELVVADARSRKTRVLAVQTDTAWVDVTDDLYFLDGGESFIWTTEVSGYRHITLNHRDGNVIQPVTTGPWEVTRIIAVNEATQQIYFTGKMDGVTQQHVYTVGYDGTRLERLTEPGGWNTVEITPDFATYIQWRSTKNTPPQISLHRISGERLRWFVEEPAPILASIELPQWEFFTFTTADGTELNATILKPPGFDPSRQHPTLIYTYGGPGSQEVTDRWGPSRGRALWHLHLAQEGYVVLVVDNRGTGGRGKAFKNLAYGDIGKWAAHDQIEAARWIGQQTWGDRERIGIWGWSGGGYLAAMALSTGSGAFKIGIAIAPVTDLRLYDTAWTERYMGLPSENDAGYEAADLLSHVADYQEGLLLVHGTGDDNVHAQHTWQLVQTLVNGNKPFDLMIYPGKAHGLSGTHYHLYSKMTAFIRDNL